MFLLYKNKWGRLFLKSFLWSLILYSSFFISLSNSRASEYLFFKSGNLELKAKVLVNNLEYPWSFTFTPNGRVLVTEKPGIIKVLNNNFEVQYESIIGVPEVYFSGQAGLFDIALDPKYPKNPYIYFSYATKGKNGSALEMARAKLEDNILIDLKILFSAKPKSNSNRHFGGKIIFDDSGHVFLTTGDRGNRNEAQNNTNHIGTIIRLHHDGKTPTKNPFYKSKTAKKEIYSFGHRNIQGAAIHPLTNEIWTNEHGPQGGDELNIIIAGENYGWPIVTFGVNYGIGTKIGIGNHKPGMVDPIYKWVPSIATSGMTFVTGKHFAEWSNDIIVSSLKAKTLLRLKIDNGKIIEENIIMKNLFGRIRNVKIGPDGYIYILTDEKNGKLIQIRKK